MNVPEPGTLMSVLVRLWLMSRRSWCLLRRRLSMNFTAAYWRWDQEISRLDYLLRNLP